MAKEFDGEVYLTVLETANYTSRAKNTIHQNWKKYGLNPVKFGKELYFKKAEVKSWLMKTATEGVQQKEVA